MRKIFCAAALMICCLPCFAQQLQRLYYRNGNKFIEGRWRYSNEAAFNVERLLTTGSSTSPGIIRLPNDYVRPDDYLFATLNIRCDGPVTIWYETGKLRAKITFADGVPKGPYAMYYPNGNIALEGWLEDGMPQGLWRSYYYKGGPYFKGNYKLYAQAALEVKCAAALQGRRHDAVEDNLDTMSTDAAQFTYTLRHAFENMIPGTGGSMKHGAFVFYNEDGSRAAEMSYKENLRDGVWKKWGAATAPPITIEYAAGKLRYLTDSSGRHTLQAYTQLKKAELERGRKAHWGEAVAGLQAEPQIFRFVEQQAAFRGNVQEYLRNNIHYPHHIKDHIDAYAAIRFFVEEDGSVSNVSLINGAYPELDAELLRVVKSMPAWSPGKYNGHAVRTGFQLNFSFGMKVDMSSLR